MSGWFLLASAIVQYQRKIKLLNLKNVSFSENAAYVLNEPLPYSEA